MGFTDRQLINGASPPGYALKTAQKHFAEEETEAEEQGPRWR